MYDYLDYCALSPWKEKIVKALPHGAGINSTWQISDKGSYLKCECSYQVMNCDGYYVGWADFSVIVPGKDPLDFRLHFHGDCAQNFNKTYQLREYLEDTIFYSLEMGLVLPIKEVV